MRVPAAGAVLALSVSACNGSRTDRAPILAAVPAPVISPAGPATAGPALGPVLGSDGRCTRTAAASAVAISPGIGECELVRLKGKPPTDVLVGESGKGQREVQVLYAEPGGRELYLFVDNRLDRIVR